MKIKKIITFAITTLMLSSIFTGCGAKQETVKQETELTPVEISKEEEKPVTRIVQHAMGETEIPVNPQRIAVLFARDVEALMVLGVTPIAATQLREGEFDAVPEFNQALKDAGVIALGDQSTPNLEKLLEVEPDLIILTGWHEIYEDASKIAPTVKLDMSGWDRFEELASILGKEAEAEEFKESYEKKIIEAKSVIKEHVKENETTLFLNVYGVQWGMGITEKTFVFNQLLFDKLGLTPAPGANDSDEQIVPSVEGIVEMNPDYMFVSIWEQDYFDEIFSQNVFQHINAFKNDRVYAIESYHTRNIKGETLAIDLILESITGEKK